MSRFPRLLLATLTSLFLALPLLAAPPAAAAENTGWSTFRQFTTNADWSRGNLRQTKVANGALSIGQDKWRLRIGGVSYGYAFWTSPWVNPGRTFTELIPSWRAATPHGTALQVFVRVRTTDGRASKFKNLGNWSSSDQAFQRSSAAAQADDIARVATDTLRSAGPAFKHYQFRVRLLRRDGADGRKAVTASPKLRSLHAVVSRLPSRYPGTSTIIQRKRVELNVPKHSQMIHIGQNPEYGGGGEAWCSPTSLAMVLNYYRKRPPLSEYAWVPAGRDRFVNHVARMTYDYRYRGTGNWPFTTGYGGTRIGESFVTRLPDLRAAERLVRAGIPVIASIKFRRGELNGAPISASNGHLLVIVGFNANGNVIVNDPAARDNASVRRTYYRGQFERAWLNGSGGVAYVLYDAKHPLPKAPAGLRAW